VQLYPSAYALGCILPPLRGCGAAFCRRCAAVGPAFCWRCAAVGPALCWRCAAASSAFCRRFSGG